VLQARPEQSRTTSLASHLIGNTWKRTIGARYKRGLTSTPSTISCLLIATTPTSGPPPRPPRPLPRNAARWSRWPLGARQGRFCAVGCSEACNGGRQGRD
jgi:hypothetical protein